MLNYSLLFALQALDNDPGADADDAFLSRIAVPDFYSLAEELGDEEFSNASMIPEYPLEKPESQEEVSEATRKSEIKSPEFSRVAVRKAGSNSYRLVTLPKEVAKHVTSDLCRDLIIERKESGRGIKNSYVPPTSF